MIPHIIPLERRKYLKVNPSHAVSDQPCTAAYLNVLASSSQEPYATICCTSRSQISNDEKSCTSLFNSSQLLLQTVRNFTTLQTNICTDKVRRNSTTLIVNCFFYPNSCNQYTFKIPFNRHKNYHLSVD